VRASSDDLSAATSAQAVVVAVVVGAADVVAGLVWVGVELVLQLAKSRATAAIAANVHRRVRRSRILVFSY
jgi:hypothetical protein